MSNTQIILSILIFALSVWLTRFIPFFLFKNTAKMPKIVEYLGKVLAPAMMGLLVIYSVKDYDFINISQVLPGIISIIAVAVLQFTKRNTVLSISVGTAIYMILIRVI